MTYQPRRTITTTALKSGKTVDGSDTYLVAASFSGNLSTGSTRSSSVTSSITRMIQTWGGALRSDSTFLPMPGNGHITTTSLSWYGGIDFVSALYRIRSQVGTGFSGTGNVLSDAVILCEIIQ